MPAFSASPAVMLSRPSCSDTYVRSKSTTSGFLKRPRRRSIRRSTYRLPVRSQAPSPTLDRLAELGFRQPREVDAAVRRWHSAAYRALRGEQARKNLDELVPRHHPAARGDRQSGRGASPPSTIFSPDCAPADACSLLLRQKPELVGFIALILGTAPRLADILARHPHVIDPLIDPASFAALPGAKELEEGLVRAVGEARGYEEVLDAIRLFGQEHMFLIGARILSGSLSAAPCRRRFRANWPTSLSGRSKPASRRILSPATGASAARRSRLSRSAGSVRAR